MSDVSDAFIERFGPPNPRVPSGLHFNDSLKQVLWEQVHAEIGAGWFLDRFLYLFGPDLKSLQPCLELWSPIVAPDHPDRMIIGRNAYGALLVMEHQGPVDESVHLLDPLTCRYWTDERIGLMNLFGAWLPRGLIPGFLDRGPYESWVRAHGALGDGEVLGPMTSLHHGGVMRAENLDRREIMAYHRAAAADCSATIMTSEKPRRRLTR